MHTLPWLLVKIGILVLLQKGIEQICSGSFIVWIKHYMNKTKIFTFKKVEHKQRNVFTKKGIYPKIHRSLTNLKWLRAPLSVLTCFVWQAMLRSWRSLTVHWAMSWLWTLSWTHFLPAIRSSSWTSISMGWIRACRSSKGCWGSLMATLRRVLMSSWSKLVGEKLRKQNESGS